MEECNNKYEEVTINGIKDQIIIELAEEEIEDNNLKCFLEDTIPLDKIIQEIEENE